MKWLIFLFLLVALIKLPAQSNDNLKNSRWINGYYEVEGNGQGWFLLELKWTQKYCTTTKDTVINGLNYVVLYDCGTQNPQYRGALRIDQDRWYFLSKDSISEMLLYDFGLQVGDTLHEGFYTETATGAWDPVVVSQIDTISVLGSPKRQIHVAGSSWIEGIGCQQGLLWDPYPNISGFGLNLECYSHNDTVRWASGDYSTTNYNHPCQLSFSLTESQKPPFDFYPNPNSGKAHLELYGLTGNSHFKVYSITGKLQIHQVVDQPKTLLDLNLPPGIYLMVLQNEERTYTSKFTVVR